MCHEIVSCSPSYTCASQVCSCANVPHARTLKKKGICFDFYSAMLCCPSSPKQPATTPRQVKTAPLSWTQRSQGVCSARTHTHKNLLFAPNNRTSSSITQLSLAAGHMSNEPRHEAHHTSQPKIQPRHEVTNKRCGKGIRGMLQMRIANASSLKE